MPPALVEGVRLDDYKRCLDPLVALATAAARDHAYRARHRHPAGRPARPHRPGQAGGHARPPLRRPGHASASGSAGTGPRPRTTASTSAAGAFVVREHLAAMEAIWSTEQAEFHGEFVDFGPTWSWPKPVQQPRVRTLIGGGASESVLRRRGRLRRRVAPDRRPRPRPRPCPACARLAETGRPRPGRPVRGPLRHHRRQGQARALRRPGRRRGRAAHPGRRRGRGPGRARARWPPSSRSRPHWSSHDRPDRRHHPAARAAPRRCPRSSASTTTSSSRAHLWETWLPARFRDRGPEGGAPGHRRDGAHRRRHLPPDLRPRRAARPTAGSTRTSSTSTSATWPPSASTATT